MSRTVLLRQEANRIHASNSKRPGAIEHALSKPPKKAASKSDKLPNHELVVVAAFLAGAQSQSVDTEDIAVKANELAPGRFTWRKYKDQINIDTVRKRLWDATKEDKGALLIGSEKTGWRLTKSGYDFARKQIKRGPVAQTKPRASRAEGATRTREMRRMVLEAAFKKFIAGLTGSITKSDAERFFRIDDYVTGKSRAAKIERFRIIAAGNADLTAVIDFLSNLLEEK
jgi:hypothetical protein